VKRKRLATWAVTNFSSSNIISVIKSRRVRWVQYVNHIRKWKMHTNWSGSLRLDWTASGYSPMIGFSKHDILSSGFLKGSNSWTGRIAIEGECLLGCCAVYSDRNWLTFQRSLLRSVPEDILIIAAVRTWNLTQNNYCPHHLSWCLT
jgi:hypothetical protein